MRFRIKSNNSNHCKSSVKGIKSSSQLGLSWHWVVFCIYGFIRWSPSIKIVSCSLVEKAGWQVCSALQVYAILTTGTIRRSGTIPSRFLIPLQWGDNLYQASIPIIENERILWYEHGKRIPQQRAPVHSCQQYPKVREGQINECFFYFEKRAYSTGNDTLSDLGLHESKNRSVQRGTSKEE